MDSSSKIFTLLFIISFLSISAAAATTLESDSDNPVTPQFLGFFRLIPKVLRFAPKLGRLPSIGMPDLPLQPPPVESELHNNLPMPHPTTCPIDTQKLGACMDFIGLKHSATKVCCPILDGLVEAEAAVCMCTTLKQKALDVKVFAPIALQVLANCGKTPPPGYTCSLSLD